MEELTNKLPELIGGSADLSGSNNTNTSKSISITDDPSGNYIFYGVREFGMNAIMNGISLHGGLIPCWNFSCVYGLWKKCCKNVVPNGNKDNIRFLS